MGVVGVAREVNVVVIAEETDDGSGWRCQGSESGCRF